MKQKLLYLAFFPFVCILLVFYLSPVTAYASKRYVVVIDAGHQRFENSELEKNGPYTDVMKKMVTAGTVGSYSKVPEYKLTLFIAKQVRKELVQRGYKVILTRSTNLIDISNKNRALIANSHKADAFIRLHANGSDDHLKHGAFTIYPSIDAVRSSSIANSSRRLSECVLNSYVNATHFKNLGLNERNDLTGCNWSTVPVTVVELGYMTNREDDTLMQTESYQAKMVQGICNGIDCFFNR